MGAKGSYESIAKALLAFRGQPTWKQADLARHLNLQTRRISQLLDELSLAGVPFEREQDHPHVYWSVPRGWFPEAVALSNDEARQLLDALLLLGPSEVRTKSLSLIFDKIFPAALRERLLGAYESDSEGGPSENVVSAIHNSLRESKALKIDYFSASAGEVQHRVVSVQSVQNGEPPRFIAFCHDTSQLKWFRMDRVQSAKLQSESIHRCSDELLDAFRKASVDGFYHGPSERFYIAVNHHVSSWVSHNLPSGIHKIKDQIAPNGWPLYEAGGALPVVARWVVSLGANAIALTENLREEVKAIAAGSLKSQQDADETK